MINVDDKNIKKLLFNVQKKNIKYAQTKITWANNNISNCYIINHKQHYKYYHEDSGYNQEENVWSLVCVLHHGNKLKKDAPLSCQ